MRPILRLPLLYKFVSKRFLTVTTLDDLKKNHQIVKSRTGNWESHRYVLRKDNVGFSMHEDVFYRGCSEFQHFKNHFVSVLVTSGRGWIEAVDQIENLGKGKRHNLNPGDAFVLNAHEKHWIGAWDEGDLHMASVFIPALKGPEMSDHHHSFPYISDDNVKHQNWAAEKEETQGKITIELKAPKST